MQICGILLKIRRESYASRAKSAESSKEPLRRVDRLRRAAAADSENRGALHSTYSPGRPLHARARRSGLVRAPPRSPLRRLGLAGCKCWIASSGCLSISNPLPSALHPSLSRSVSLCLSGARIVKVNHCSKGNRAEIFRRGNTPGLPHPAQDRADHAGNLARHPAADSMHDSLDSLSGAICPTPRAGCFSVQRRTIPCSIWQTFAMVIEH